MLRLSPTLLLLTVGCHSLVSSGKPAAEAPATKPTPVPHVVETKSATQKISAETLWQNGQDAMKAGNTDSAIRLYLESLALDPKQHENHLSLGAAYLASGREVEACEHLGLFLKARPLHASARFYYAELLLKCGKHAEALTQFEKNIAQNQADANLDHAQLAHCHGRILEVGEKIDDEYLVHLHRGIGMYWLALRRNTLPETLDDGPSTESLLFKSAAELTQARKQRPAEARPCWYLHEVWRLLAQQHLAQRWLHATAEAAPFSYLTPSEHHLLQLALRNMGPTRP